MVLNVLNLTSTVTEEPLSSPCKAWIMLDNDHKIYNLVVEAEPWKCMWTFIDDGVINQGCWSFSEQSTFSNFEFVQLNYCHPIIVCSGSVVVTAYDLEFSCPGSNPEWGLIYYKSLHFAFAQQQFVPTLYCSLINSRLIWIENRHLRLGWSFLI